MGITSQLKKTVQRALMARGYAIEKFKHTGVAPLDVFDLIVRNHMARTDDFFFLQVGANDGVRFDPIHPYIKEFHWQGILVEPVPYLFDSLRENYKDEPQLLFERAALAREDGTVPFHALRDEADVPEAVRGLGSMDRNVILAHGKYVPGIEALIEEISVPAMTVMTLLKKHGVDKLDLLQVDTEGFDYEILKMLDFAALKPAIIRFEHIHLSSADWREACHMLAGHGYRLACKGLDTMAYLQPKRDRTRG